MSNWYVITPEYETVLDIICDGQGPIERVADVIEIEADTPRDALALGVKAMLQDRSRRYRWCKDARSSRENPYAGVRVLPTDA